MLRVYSMPSLPYSTCSSNIQSWGISTNAEVSHTLKTTHRIQSTSLAKNILFVIIPTEVKACDCWMKTMGLDNKIYVN